MKQEREELIKAFGMCAAWYELQTARNTSDTHCREMVASLRFNQQRIIEEGTEHDAN
jgi:hypothetical protein